MLHGVQLAGSAGTRRATLRRLEHHVPPVVSPAAGVRAAASSARSSGRTPAGRDRHTAAGAEVVLDPGASGHPWILPVTSEVAVLLDTGTVTYAGRELAVGDLAVVEAGTRHTPLRVVAGESGARGRTRWSALRGGG